MSLIEFPAHNSHSYPANYSLEERQTLLQLACTSVKEGLKKGRPLQINTQDYPGKLSENRATFVTININHDLRGCIGSLKPTRPLVQDVINNAYSAAFSDPRFPPVASNELARLTMHIAILTLSEPIKFNTEEDLITKIRPGIDGLILTERHNRGTFLPAVWESLPDRRVFLRHLKQKAGLPPDYWSNTIKIERYTTEVIE